MINFIKKITRFAIILILIGAILFVTAFAISGFNFEKMSGIKTTYSTFN